LLPRFERSVEPQQPAIAVAGVVTFAFLGALQAIYGPLLPGLQRSFALGTGDVGLVFASHGFGALSGILVPSFVAARRFANHWLSFATALILVGSTALSIAPNWPLLLAAAFVLAVGLGIHVVRLNSLFVTGFGARGITMSLLINAGFSGGAVLGPLAVSVLGEPSLRVFRAAALLSLLLLPVHIALDRTGKSAAFHELRDSHTGNRRRARSRAPLWAFVALMCLSSGAENSIGGWTATLALAHGCSFASAANLTALFFAAIFLGRLLAAGFGHRVSPAWLVIGGIASVAALAGLSYAMRGAPLVLALTGLVIAPVFSATLVWLGSALSTESKGNAIVIAGAVLGAALFPPLVGRVIGVLGASGLVPAIFAIATAALALALAILRCVPHSRHRPHEARVIAQSEHGRFRTPGETAKTASQTAGSTSGE